ncbi:hypothetical protein HOLleu_10814 [Holothuria leucospilota]|uniref:Uncharacterized protein n=1 Tax=Holothuria leucospilota TaxID=206669 RepID=A0A9Q1CET5_HOLLE|nr:hypothetical protein HOLleu_10814 [Holothuria leucospilota]
MAQPPRLIQGDRSGGHILVHDGYRYERNRAVVGRKIHRRCADQLCRAPLQTNYFVPGPEANIAVLGPVPPPNHPHRPEIERIDRHGFMTSVKNTIEQDPSLPIRRAYETEYVDSSQPTPRCSNLRGNEEHAPAPSSEFHSYDPTRCTRR